MAFREGFGVQFGESETLRLSRVDHPDGPLLVAVLAFERPMSEVGPLAEEIVRVASFAE